MPAQDDGEMFEATVFLPHFRDLPDSRQPGKVIYPLDEVLLLDLLATLAGSVAFTDIARFGEKTLPLLRRCRPFYDGTPLHDRIGGIFATLDAEQFLRCIVAWVASVTGIAAGVIAIDGKAVRRPGRRRDNKAPIHMVSAFATRQRLVLGQVKVADKSNEIITIPGLLNMPEIEGVIVIIGAMGCPRGIARTIRDKKADYVLAVKGTQEALHTDVQLLIAEQKTRDFADTRTTRDTTVDGDHGRIETRTTSVIHDVAWLQERHDWPGLEPVVMVKSSREANAKIEYDTRLYLTSLVMVASLMGPVVRSHWAIENSLHWVMNMMFRDDDCRVRTENAPANFTTIKHMAHNLLRATGGKDPLRLRRKVTPWDDDLLARIIAR